MGKQIICIIPTRVGSSRFPGKPLAKINGIPMLGHVYFRSKMSRSMDEVYVATRDEEIREYVEGVGGYVVMTKDTHERAWDRTVEAMMKIEEARGEKVDIVVMIQGDEPMLYPEMIDEAVMPLIENKKNQIVDRMALLRSREEHEDPNEIKEVVDSSKDSPIISQERPFHPVRYTDGMEKSPCISRYTLYPFAESI